MSLLSALISGLLFGAGLILSGMGNPAKVLAFLDLAGAWDPSLALVMVGAISVAFPAFHWAKRQPKHTSLLGKPITLPQRPLVDRKLIVGAVLFGIGWGLAGYCPGPALTTLLSAGWPAILFVIALLTGLLIVECYSARHP